MTNLVDFLIPTTDRGPSPSIWGRCPWHEIALHPEVGFTYWNDFTAIPGTPPTAEGLWGDLQAYGSASTPAAFTPDDTIGGGLQIGLDGDNEGAAFRTFATPFKLIRGAGRMWFEMRLKCSSIGDTLLGFLAGFYGRTAITTNASTISATSPIAAAGTLEDVNFVGFQRLEVDGDKLNTTYRADGVAQVVLQEDAVTLVADTHIKIGMMFQPRSVELDGEHYLSFFQNGNRLANSYQIPAAAGTAFPNDVNMSLVFALLNATASTPGTVSIDWIRGAQEFLT